MRQLDLAGHEHEIGELARPEQLAAFDRAAFSARVPGTLPMATDPGTDGRETPGDGAVRPDPIRCPKCGKPARQGPHHSGYCPACFYSWRTDKEGN